MPPSWFEFKSSLTLCGMGGTKRGREEKNTKMVRRQPSDPNKHKPVRRANFRASACAVAALSLLLSVGTSMCFTGALVAQGPHGEGRGLDRIHREGRGAPTHPQYGQSGPRIAMQLRPSPDPVRSVLSRKTVKGRFRFDEHNADQIQSNLI